MSKYCASSILYSKLDIILIFVKVSFNLQYLTTWKQKFAKRKEREKNPPKPDRCKIVNITMRVRPAYARAFDWRYSCQRIKMCEMSVYSSIIYIYILLRKFCVTECPLLLVLPRHNRQINIRLYFVLFFAIFYVRKIWST